MNQVFITIGLALCIMACGSDLPPQVKPTPEATPNLTQVKPTPEATPNLNWQWDDSAEIGIEYAYTIGTHCGIEYARFDGREWAAHPPPELRGPNPPPGWSGDEGDVAEGTMVLVEPDLARFTNNATREQVDFTPWPQDREQFECF